MYSNLLEDFEKFERIINENIDKTVFDLTKYSFLPITTLIPLISYNNDSKVTYKVGGDSGEYVKRILGLNQSKDTTIPFIEIDEINQELSNKFINLMQKNFSNWDANVMEYTVFEILSNIGDHSQYSKAYSAAQYYPSANVIDLCFIDNGISIPTNFEKSNFDFEDDVDAICQAINGKSTKSNIDTPRGTGLNSTINLVTQGNKGEVLLVSRKGLIYITPLGVVKKKIINNNLINGTFICFRFNNHPIENFYQFIKFNLIKIH